MPDDRPTLALAHSADPDDVFMWWPLTGIVGVEGGVGVNGGAGDGVGPAIDTGRFVYRSVPGDIAAFNRLASGPAPHDITALSVRAYADVADRYVLTSCGASFGLGYGPKVVARVGGPGAHDLHRPDVRIAIPGRETSAFLTLALCLGLRGDAGPRGASPAHPRFVETPFDAIIPAVVEGRVDAGLVIHEGQVLFERAGLRQAIDLGQWWGETRGLPLPLGVNAVKRDLDARFGPGTIAHVAERLRASLAHALAHRDESLRACVPFARVNALRSGIPEPDLATIDRYVAMYVNRYTQDMAGEGRAAIARLLAEGADAGLCPRTNPIDVV
ncbi:MAG: MqnA/MqnD/SBP family protein [Planctomycetota bacterium]|nr:MqnA/MqnD/SBP family protein [Planctomycetota bacterium]